MPVCLFTLHTYGSWMVDRLEGHHNRRVRGVQGCKPDLGRHHRHLMIHRERICGEELQRLCLLELPEASRRQAWRLHAAGSCESHLHLLASWSDDRLAEALRRSIKHSLSLAAALAGAGRPLFSRAGDCYRVHTRRKLEYHRLAYLPDHPGWFFDPLRGLRPPAPSQHLVRRWRSGGRVPDGPFATVNA